MSIFNSFPDKETLLNKHKLPDANKLKANAHVHTPYSFSAFGAMGGLFAKAREENISILGVNDFNTTRGYEEFARLASENGVFPLFNIEFIGLLKREQEKGIRINDPNNPGRIYFCGKGLDYPITFSEGNKAFLDQLSRQESEQSRQMCEKLNAYLSEKKAGFGLSFDQIEEQLARHAVRERHLAKALRLKLQEHHNSPDEMMRNLATILETERTALPQDDAAIENLIRGKLLKKGGPAYIPENPAAFPDLQQLIAIIRDGGGIPCYPVLLDDANGKYTDFEEDFDALAARLTELGVHCVELIPGRNNLKELERFTRFFDEKGFLVTYGTEHNSPVMEPLSISCRNAEKISEWAIDIHLNSVFAMAAHQYLRTKGEDGLAKAQKIRNEQKSELIRLGKAVFMEYLNS